jgi:hypothetical protein
MTLLCCFTVQQANNYVVAVAGVLITPLACERLFDYTWM